ncbi:helix-hairpin-helix domain-containing protein [Pseudoflavitalea sp. X16]|uniref:ComEA family DNA-binding protein n=1 Tax=Paraflavitalea devenefica TaxID=2716334 RepID=UPI00141D7E0B|nr:helix-hairpin-helix domain-containing protein [Paraflavitalea devenefica]NII23751.1 helix-hairpin-helix domain-containing protein [Paraflavitalea devenefica]
MKNYLREYFSFTKKERTGIIVLLVLIGVTVALPYFIRVPSTPPDRAAFEKLQQQLAQLETAKDSGYEAPYTPDHDLVTESRDEEVVLFAFDPNRLPAEGWKRLGIRERTAHVIQHYLAKGGRFRRPDDLYKIYGLRKEEVDRLLPYVTIEAIEPAKERPVAGRTPDSIAHHNLPKRFKEPAVIDINTADTTAFIALRGIGSKLAQRIVHFREKLGGFYAVEQVGETYGLPDSTFQQIRKLLHCPSPALRTININVTDVTTLQQHPYIRWPLANAIVQYRQQHGVYESVDQLLQINTVTPVVLEKIRPYLAIE